MTKAKNVGVELTDEQALGLHRNAAEYDTTVEQLVHDIVAEWLDRHGTGEVFTPGAPRIWPEGEQEKAEKADKADKRKADAEELAEAQKAEAARVKARDDAADQS